MKILTIVGARPQFIKAAVVSSAIAAHNQRHDWKIEEKIVHTGQHFDANMSAVFFDEMRIPAPAYHLGINSGMHGVMTGRMLEKIEAVLTDEKPDWVMVYGDTNSTLAGALAAVKLHVPVAHVEAGLRSYNRRMPEEINRIVADQLSTVLFCPTETAVENLRNEGFPHKLSVNSRQVVANVGDVMYDAALFYAAMAEEKSLIMQTLGLNSKSFVLVSIHRAENTDDSARLTGIMEALNEISKEIPVALPLHPRTQKMLALANNFSKLYDSSSITFIDPVGYLDMVMLEKNARVIITDSGGVQKEAYFHGVPCVTVREETEWVELVEVGANFIAGTERGAIIKAFMTMKDQVINSKKLYGSGNSAAEIINLLTCIESF